MGIYALISICIVHLQSRYIMFPLTRGFSFLSCCERNETKKANQGEASKMPIPLDNPLCYVGTHTLRTVPREQTDKPEFVKLFIVGKRCSSLNRLSSRLRAGSACQTRIYISQNALTLSIFSSPCSYPKLYIWRKWSVSLSKVEQWRGSLGQITKAFPSFSCSKTKSL